MSRFTRRAPVLMGSYVSVGQSSRDGGSSATGPWPSSTKWAWRVAAQFGIIAIGKIRCVGWVVPNLYVENSGQAAQSLCADAECIDLLVEIDPEFLRARLWAALHQLLNVDGIHQ